MASLEQNVAFASFENSFDIKIKENGYAILDKEWSGSGEDRKALFSRMYYILKGKAYLVIDGKKVIMEPSNLYFLPLGLKYTYGCDDYAEKLYFHINISVAEITHMYDLFCNCNELVVLKKDNIPEMADMYKNNSLLDFLRLKSIIYSDIVRILEKADIGKISIKTYSDLCFRVLEYIKKNLSANLKIKNIAADMYISESKLNKMFFSETGIQIGKYIDDVLFFEIEKDVLAGIMTDEEISYKYCFSDKIYFGRFFKKRTGYTPRQYRMSNVSNTKIITY